MRLRRLTTGAVSFFLLLCLFAVLSSLPVRAELVVKIGYVTVQKVFDEYLKKVDLETQLKTEFDTRERELQALGKELMALKEELKAQELLLTESAREEREAEISQKEVYVNNLKGSISQDFQKKQEEYSQIILADIMGKIKEIAERDGYRLVFDSIALLYATPEAEFDLTDTVLSELNQAYQQNKAG